MLRAGTDGAKNIKAGYRTGGTFGNAACRLAGVNYNCRTMVLVHYSRSDNSYDAGVPVFAGKDNTASVGMAQAPLNYHFAGLFEYLSFTLLTLTVLLFEILGYLHRTNPAAAC